ncbi:MBL fold metallo-hydrolase [Plebeiibacterium sediminum]|uniref:MBL fold metallo-hydrolase n=1 Tax=Plebeiibacterium sediminum TaxID=2992112 RepID=A0AAE3M7S9_9BACT|nr:MBL fold metallo-hydrolase [Plebeiobacterium sediminum]MCW3788846.1 MBL fold metallo-hydrolase [Plebeiobacterium sediminum]
MKLTVLSENTAGGSLLAEHGLSYYIEVNETKILLDTGHSDVFKLNAQKLGINIDDDIDLVVLSHGHWDHGGGLAFLKDKKLITHPKSFIKRYRAGGDQNIGLTLNKEEIQSRYDLLISEEPYYITDHVVFLGGIPRLNDFEAKTTPFEDEYRKPDFVPDDSAIVVIQDNQLIIITGCSHSGICNIIEYAKKVIGISKVLGVIGGFHLKYNNLQTQNTIEYLKKQSIQYLYPSHCTALPALAAFYDVFKIEQVKTGMVINL